MPDSHPESEVSGDAHSVGPQSKCPAPAELERMLTSALSEEETQALAAHDERADAEDEATRLCKESTNKRTQTH